jgi:nitroreductase
MLNPELTDIFARRSVREYRQGEVSEDMLRDLLAAGMAAPSARAQDPWHFIVIRKEDTLNRIADGLPYGQMLRQAAVGIVVCGDLHQAHDEQESYMLQDCSAAIENILLAASKLGLGAVWLGVHPRAERLAHMREVFGLPDAIIPISVISLGWPTQQPAPRTRYKEKAVHWEQW